MKFIVDKEINLNNCSQDSSSDLLHTKCYASILLQSVKDAPQGESYTIGLFGEWGSGKSSVIKTMNDAIAADSQMQKVKVVNYDAWKYSGDSFRRMFLLQLQQELGYERTELMNSFYLNSSEDAHIDTKVDYKMFIIGFAIVASVCVAIAKLNCLSTDFKIAANAIVALGSLFYTVIKGFLKELKININRPHMFAPEQFEECYMEMCQKAFSEEDVSTSLLKYISNNGKGSKALDRLVIVIDNIDRCQPEVAYTLLTDIKNFLCKDINVVFVVPVDVDALRKHIVSHSSAEHSIEANEFLRKFFNTSIWMKPYQNDEMFDFANNIAQRNGLGFKPDTIALVANEFATNPRRIIQLFNNLQIELSNYDNAFAQEHQALICKLLIIREEFSAYYKQLLANPVLLFKDVALIRVKGADRLEDEEKALTSDSRLFAFLLASTGVSSRYEGNEDIVLQILVNSQSGDTLPENILQAYRTANSEEIVSYARDSIKRDLLLNYLQDNIKKMVMRQTINAEGKTHIDVLLALFDNNLLTADDKKRLFEPIESTTTLSKIVNLYKDKQPLIRLGNDLETLRLPKLTACLESKLKSRDITREEMTIEDTRNVFYAASIWPVERCKNIRETFLEALEKNPVECRNYAYDKDKYTTLFSNEVYKHIFDKLSVDDCSDERSTFQTFRYLCHLQAVNKTNLLLFINKAIEIAPAFDRKNPQKLEPITYIKVLTEIFGELRYLGFPVPLVTMTQLFDKVNAASSVSTSSTYNRTVTTIHSLVTDKAGDDSTAEIISQFFINVNFISDGPVVSNAEIERFMKTEQNYDRILDALMILKGQGKDICTWTKAVITDLRRIDTRRIELLRYAFVQKDEEGNYKVSDDVVKNEIGELINVIQRNEDGSNSVVEMPQSIIEDERVDQIVRSILSQKTLDEQKQLPVVLMQRAITSFEKNINALGIPGDINILQLIASNGSESGVEGVWGIVNPILADGKNQPPANVNGAIQILLSFSKLTKDQADALAANVKTLPAGKLAEEKKKEVLGFLKGLKNIS